MLPGLAPNKMPCVGRLCAQGALILCISLVLPSRTLTGLCQPPAPTSVHLPSLGLTFPPASTLQEPFLFSRVGSARGPRVFQKSGHNLGCRGLCGCLWNKGPWFCRVFERVCVYFLRTVQQTILSGLVPVVLSVGKRLSRKGCMSRPNPTAL